MTDNGTATGDPVFNIGLRGKKIARAYWVDVRALCPGS